MAERVVLGFGQQQYTLPRLEVFTDGFATALKRRGVRPGVERSVGHAALAVAGSSDRELLGAYLHSRAQSVMGGTSQIQKNIIASRILGLGV
jgi:alkylation response protein AidB-like acyl-CoA dehydrogenase